MNNPNNANHADKFKILVLDKFLLVIWLLTPLVMIGALIYFNTEVQLSDKAPFVFAFLGIWAIYESYIFHKWIYFTVSLSDEGITIKNRFIKWEEIKSYESKNAVRFSTFIRLNLQDGNKISIPAAIQKAPYILRIIDKHVTIS